MKRVAVLTSGGDAPGMNAAVRAAVRCGCLRQFEMLGVRDGYEGLMRGDLVALGPRDVGGVLHQGGTFLGTSRTEAFKTADGQRKALECVKSQRIDALVVVGGNGSQSGSQALAAQGLQVVGIASTIDNDLLGTDITIGASTATDIALEAIDRLRTTAAALRRVFLVEVMGRHSGYLAAMTAIAGGAEALIVPEAVTSAEEAAQQLELSRLRGKRHAIIVMAEGAALKVDEFAAYLQDVAHHHQGFEVKTTRLGHVQRGGAPNAFDRLLATRLGAASIDHLMRGDHGVLVGMINGSIATTPLEQVANRSKPLNLEWLRLATELAQ